MSSRLQTPGPRPALGPPNIFSSAHDLIEALTCVYLYRRIRMSRVETNIIVTSSLCRPLRLAHITVHYQLAQSMEVRCT